MDEEILTGAEEQEIADPDVTVDTETETVEPTGEVEEVATQKSEEDSRFASVRRKAEADAKAKYDAEAQRLNAEFKRLFGEYTNPVTGRPIETPAEYIQAIEAQKRASTEAQLKEKGIDPNLINDLIQNSPVIRQAETVLKQASEAEAQARLDADLKAVGQIDPSIKSAEDIEKLPSYPAILEYVNKGLNLVDAYKLANFSALSEKQANAVRQASINQANSKSHMTPTSGIAVAETDLAPIPEKVLNMWKSAYPGLSISELTKKYNDSI